MNQQYAWLYNEITREYIDKIIIDKDQLNPSQYLNPPANSLPFPPQGGIKEYQSIFEENGQWWIKEDYRYSKWGKKFYHKETKEVLIIEKIGDVPGKDYVDTAYRTIWDTWKEGQGWIFDIEKCRAERKEYVENLADQRLGEIVPLQQMIKVTSGYTISSKPHLTKDTIEKTIEAMEQEKNILCSQIDKAATEQEIESIIKNEKFPRELQAGKKSSDERH